MEALPLRRRSLRLVGMARRPRVLAKQLHQLLIRHAELVKVLVLDFHEVVDAVHAAERAHVLVQPGEALLGARPDDDVLRLVVHRLHARSLSAQEMHGSCAKVVDAPRSSSPGRGTTGTP